MGKEQPHSLVAKHAVKVHVLAGIAKCGATKICVIDQIMNAQVYVGVREDFLVPFIAERFF